MRIVGLEMLNEFSTTYGEARCWIANWVAETTAATWTKPQDIKERHASASFLPENVVNFNIKGNWYRLETQISHELGVVGIRWVGTHSAYDRRTKRSRQ